MYHQSTIVFGLTRGLLTSCAALVLEADVIRAGNPLPEQRFVLQNFDDKLRKVLVENTEEIAI